MEYLFQLFCLVIYYPLTINTECNLRSNIHYIVKPSSYVFEDNKIIYTLNKNGIGIITLNRPQHENIPTTEMLRDMKYVIQNWDRSEQLMFFIIEGANQKFCSTTEFNLTAFIEGKPEGEKLYQEFSEIFYETSLQFVNKKTPSVSIANGIIGAGCIMLAEYNTFQVVTEKTTFIMPEGHSGTVTILTDILKRIKSNIGLYIALTGNTISGSDMYHLNLATHYIKSNNMKKLKHALVKCQKIECLKETLDRYQEEPKRIPKLSLAPYENKINTYFSEYHGEDMLEAVLADKSHWIQKNIAHRLSAVSPTCFKLILKMFQKDCKSINSSLLMEQILRRNWYYSGELMKPVKAKLKFANISLENNKFDVGQILQKFNKVDIRPAWHPPTLEAVTEKYLEFFLKDTPKDCKIKLS